MHRCMHTTDWHSVTYDNNTYLVAWPTLFPMTWQCSCTTRTLVFMHIHHHQCCPHMSVRHMQVHVKCSAAFVPFKIHVLYCQESGATKLVIAYPVTPQHTSRGLMFKNDCQPCCMCPIWWHGLVQYLTLEICTVVSAAPMPGISCV